MLTCSCRSGRCTQLLLVISNAQSCSLSTFAPQARRMTRWQSRRPCCESATTRRVRWVPRCAGCTGGGASMADHSGSAPGLSQPCRTLAWLRPNHTSWSSAARLACRRAWSGVTHSDGCSCSPPSMPASPILSGQCQQETHQRAQGRSGAAPAGALHGSAATAAAGRQQRRRSGRGGSGAGGGGAGQGADRAGVCSVGNGLVCAVPCSSLG